MDGIDGLAATMGIIGFAAYGLAAAAVGITAGAAAQASARASAPALLALAAALLPFFFVNRPRASMFMGDVGAVPLGFLAGAFGVAGSSRAAWPAWFPLLVFLPFVADATLTLCAAAARGASAGGRGIACHYYQRLHQLGAGHAGTLAAYAALMVGTSVTALACRALRAGCRLVGTRCVDCCRRSCCSPRLIIIGARRPRSGHSMTLRFNWRASLAFVHDVCWPASHGWRSTGCASTSTCASRSSTDMWFTLAWILPLQAAIFLALGLYRGLWRFASMLDLQRIVLAAGLGAMLIPLVLVMLKLQAVVPRSVLFFYPIVLIFLMAGSRFAYRIWKEHRLYSPLAALGEPVLVVGAGEAGARLTDEMARSRQWRVVGLLDDDATKHGRLLRNVSVLGPDRRPRRRGSRRYGVRKVIIALPSANHAVRRRVAELCAAAHVEALTVPAYEDLISGRSPLTMLRTVELDDLLGRDPVVLDNAGLAEWLGNRDRDGHRRRRLDRRRAVPPDRALPPRAARAVRHLRSGALRDQDGAGRRVSAAAASSRSSATSSTRRSSSRRSRARSPT